MPAFQQSEESITSTLIHFVDDCNPFIEFQFDPKPNLIQVH
jgi:uncharacterized protein (DUF1499 family)